MKTKLQIDKMKDSGEKFYTKMKHLFDIPFRLLIVGKSQLSGKTNFVGNILLKENFYKGKFKGEDIYIVSPSTKTDKKLSTIITQLDIPKENIFKSYNEEELEVLYDILEDDYKEATENKRKVSNKLVFFDDMSYGGMLKNQRYGIIAKLFANGRHLNISTIVTAQTYSDILVSARENATGIILFGCSTRQLELIADDHNYIKKKEFYEMFRKCTNEKHSFLVINYTNDFAQRYMTKNFEPICVCEDNENKCKGIKISNTNKTAKK